MKNTHTLVFLFLIYFISIANCSIDDNLLQIKQTVHKLDSTKKLKLHDVNSLLDKFEKEQSQQFDQFNSNILKCVKEKENKKIQYDKNLKYIDDLKIDLNLCKEKYSESEIIIELSKKECDNLTFTLENSVKLRIHQNLSYKNIFNIFEKSFGLLDEIINSIDRIGVRPNHDTLSATSSQLLMLSINLDQLSFSSVSQVLSKLSKMSSSSLPNTSDSLFLQVNNKIKPTPEIKSEIANLKYQLQKLLDTYTTRENKSNEDYTKLKNNLELRLKNENALISSHSVSYIENKNCINETDIKLQESLNNSKDYDYRNLEILCKSFQDEYKIIERSFTQRISEINSLKKIVEEKLQK